tara:strand:- start:909 stop:2108 length:1200 start_codon:yes stop_codon:yes gene_type:complete
MNRVLNRPMFRMGGSTGTGITSGLDKPKRGLVNEPGKYSQTEADMATTPISKEEIIRQAKGDASKFSYVGRDQMSGKDIASRFLIPFGLNLATATPTGSGFSGLLSTAAGAAKDPADAVIRGMDKRRDARTERESELFGSLLSSGLQERREDKKLAIEKLKENRELLTLYDNELEKNVIVKASDVYNDLTRYGPSKKDETGRTFEKLEVANLIDQKMSEIFELEAKKNKTTEDTQAIEQAKGVLNYLQGNKNTSVLANAILKDSEYLATLRNKIKKKLKTTEKFAESNPTTDLLLQQTIDDALEFYIENGSFPPELALAEGGRVEYQMGGDVDPMVQNNPKIDYDTLRARLPQEISDDIVTLIASSPEALEDFATIQTQQDVVNFNNKYNVELTLPAEA